MIFKKIKPLENLLIGSLIFTFFGFSSADNPDYVYNESKISGEEATRLVNFLKNRYYNDPTWDYGILFEDTCSKQYNGKLYTSLEKETINLTDINIMAVKSKTTKPNQYVKFVKEKGVYIEVKGSVVRFSFDEISEISTKKGGEMMEIILKDGEKIKGKYVIIPAITSGQDFYTGKQRIGKKEVDFSQRINYIGNDITLKIEESAENK